MMVVALVAVVAVAVVDNIRHALTRSKGEAHLPRANPLTALVEKCAVVYDSNSVILATVSMFYNKTWMTTRSIGHRRHHCSHHHAVHYAPVGVVVVMVMMTFAMMAILSANQMMKMMMMTMM